MNEITQVRKRAARILTRRGWTRGKYERCGRYCLLGAIYKAARQVVGARAEFQMTRLVGEAIGFPGLTGLTTWNDRQTHKSKVIARLLDGCEGGQDR